MYAQTPMAGRFKMNNQPKEILTQERLQELVHPVNPLTDAAMRKYKSDLETGEVILATLINYGICLVLLLLLLEVTTKFNL